MIEPDYPFRSDGCTFSPDGVWRQCCDAHDRDYWMGGTREERLASDERLRKCIYETIIDVGWPSNPKSWLGRFWYKHLSPRLSEHETASLVSQLYYRGVRIGGVGWLPTQFRWGFGWPYPRTGP